MSYGAPDYYDEGSPEQDDLVEAHERISILEKTLGEMNAAAKDTLETYGFECRSQDPKVCPVCRLNAAISAAEAL